MNALPPAHDATAPDHPLVLRANAMGFAYPGLRLLENLSFELPAGLSFVRGGEGRGKTTLLRLLAGELQPSAGRLERMAPPLGTACRDIFGPGPDDGRDSPATPQQWLQTLSPQLGAWDQRLLDDLIEGFALEEHLQKSMSMLSTGTRRKVWLAGAFASGAQLTLLEKPFAALDARSRDLLSELLQEAAKHPHRAWVLADYELPPGLASAKLAGLIDLGD